MSSWINISALWKVVVFGLILGAGLPLLFAAGVRAQAIGTNDSADGSGDTLTETKTSPLGTAIASICFAIVAVAVIIGILFVARDFIGSHLGLYILGAKAK